MWISSSTANEKFRALMEDLRNAEHFIHIQYYIIKNDVLFNQIKDILIEKAAQGVEVRVLFDAMGCRSVRHSYWKWLNERVCRPRNFSRRSCGGFSFVSITATTGKLWSLTIKWLTWADLMSGRNILIWMKSSDTGEIPSADLRQCGTGAPGAIYFRLELCGRRESVFASGAVPRN